MNKHRIRSTLTFFLVVGLKCFFCSTIYAITEPLVNGYFHHGVATPVSNHRGVVATIDGKGREVVLAWLYDHRGGYALLLVDAEDGTSEQIPMPFSPDGDGPYASLLSRGNKFYTHFNSHFTEFDPAAHAFTFTAPTAPQMAMSITEDDNGVIWSVTYPQSGVVSFDPASRAFRDYGQVYKQDWNQYPRTVAADDAGWIYFGIGNTASQIIAFNPTSGEAKPMLEPQERITGSGYVARYVNGRVYGHGGGGAKDSWFEFYRGTRMNCLLPENLEEKRIITGSQSLFHTEFPGGNQLKSFNLTTRTLEVENPVTSESYPRAFNYTSEGAHIMGVIAASDGTLCGGTSFPMRFFSFAPRTDTWTNVDCYGQWNTMARQGDRVFIGGYGGGFLLEWQPSAPWAPTENKDSECNPRFLTECTPTIHRPHELLAHPDGTRLILAGTPGYGYTGGGLLFWDRQTGTKSLLEHNRIIPDQSTMSLAALPDNKLLGGTTTSPGTGGETKATVAELYIMDLGTKQVEWHEAVFPGIREYTDLHATSNGLIFGIGDRRHFFVFDPIQRKVLHEEDTAAHLGPTCYQQGPRVFTQGPDGTLYMLFTKGVAKVDIELHDITLLAESPVPIICGGDILDGRLYFGSGSHLYSYQLPAGLPGTQVP